MRISDWSSDVCSSDLDPVLAPRFQFSVNAPISRKSIGDDGFHASGRAAMEAAMSEAAIRIDAVSKQYAGGKQALDNVSRSEEHTSELQSLMRISYAVFCLKKKNKTIAKKYKKCTEVQHRDQTRTCTTN